MSTVTHRFYMMLASEIRANATPEFYDVMTAWQSAEGGDAAHNPFNTTRDAPGSTQYNSVGVKNYPTMEEGVRATAQTLLNGYYNKIVDALRRGAPHPYHVADLIGKSPWGTSGVLIKEVLRSHGVPEHSAPHHG